MAYGPPSRWRLWPLKSALRVPDRPEDRAVTNLPLALKKLSHGGIESLTVDEPDRTGASGDGIDLIGCQTTEHRGLIGCDP